jgi:hypothetical protein
MRSFAAFCSILCAVALGASPHAGRAQATASPPTQTLSAAPKEFADGFTSVFGFRELSDGRVIIADLMERSVWLIDLTAGTRKPIGRQGAGPEEFSMPAGVFAIPNDMTLVGDPMHGRMLHIAPTGAITATSPFVGDGGMPATVLGADRQGRLYWEGPAIAMPKPGQPMVIAMADSVPILRRDLATNKTDTVTFLKKPDSGVEIGMSSTEMPAIHYTHAPIPPDSWMVAPDGAIVIAHPSDYHVTWVTPPGARVDGPIVAFTRQKVSDAENKEQRDKTQAAMNSMGVPPGAGGINLAEIPTPEFKPPFQGPPVIGPDGRAWLSRTVPKDSPPTYDLFDRRGQLTGRVVLPARTTVLGFGKGVIYLIRTDDADLQYLQRYRWP